MEEVRFTVDMLINRVVGCRPDIESLFIDVLNDDRII